MQTHFSADQLADPRIREADDILRKCSHCGFCLATCPTYVVLGNELDSPRGRIYLIKGMLEGEGGASAKVAKHIDRCLSCLSCVTTCPAGVDYMHLVDYARVRIETSYRRPWSERLLRALLAVLLTRPAAFRLALTGARLVRPLRGLLPGRLKSIVAMAPGAVPAASPVDRPQVFPAEGVRRRRVALLTGCVQRVLRPGINEATVRLLTRHGCEVAVVGGVGCCGALVHHMGRDADARAAARANIAAWERAGDGLDAVVVNASGCGTMLKDYGFMLRDDPEWRDRAGHIAAITRDVSEILADLGLNRPVIDSLPAVAYHSACSMEHGQGLGEAPRKLLAEAGFRVLEAGESHLCCGSAGTYNLLQPRLAADMRRRKVASLETTGARIIATGNIGCLVQIAGGTKTPVVHSVELLDWATGGPKPADLDGAPAHG